MSWCIYATECVLLQVRKLNARFTTVPLNFNLELLEIDYVNFLPILIAETKIFKGSVVNRVFICLIMGHLKLRLCNLFKQKRNLKIKSYLSELLKY